MQGSLSSRTGRGIRVAIIDSGVHAAHPHVGGVAEGLQITVDGDIGPDFTDRLGHGTAVTAAVKQQAPHTEIIAIKVFDRGLSTSARALVRAIEAAIDRDAHLVNLSLGTTRQEHRPMLERVVRTASAACVPIIAAAPTAREIWLPGALPEVIAVALDWACPRDRYRAVLLDGSRRAFAASGYPREIPGVSPERNLKGLSFAVANMTGFAALALEGLGRVEPGKLLELLSERAA
ncbi:MAG: S8 family serine peptidase [Acidobacteria bacterium]|nr:S8 family serine peptidase [Acidobacteriota bacterium]